MLNIKQTDRVLEIGSGNRPRKRSNILCDRYIESNYERAGEENLVIDKRPFVVADGQALPFREKSFEYVITSHILEHVDDPKRFVAELTRVARAGYIETPSELGEKIFGWPFHKWIVRIENDTIVMRPRTIDSPFKNYFHQMYQNDFLFAEFIDSHFSDYYVQYEWKGTIPLRIEEDFSTDVKFSNPSQIISVGSRIKQLKITMVKFLINILLKFLRHFRKLER
jgi:SAM-dependent methyltransferase